MHSNLSNFKALFLSCLFSRMPKVLYLIIGWLLVKFQTCFALKSFLCFPNPANDSAHKSISFSPRVLQKCFFSVKKKIVPVQPNNLHATFQLGTVLSGSVTQLSYSSCPAVRESTLPWRSRDYIMVRSSQGCVANEHA